jgi:hypothetical protein
MANNMRAITTVTTAMKARSRVPSLVPPIEHALNMYAVGSFTRSSLGCRSRTADRERTARAGDRVDARRTARSPARLEPPRRARALPHGRNRAGRRVSGRCIRALLRLLRAARGHGALPLFHLAAATNGIRHPRAHRCRDWHARPPARCRQDPRCHTERRRVRRGRRRSIEDMQRG